MFDIILFDLDGTLTDPKEGITKSVQYALRHLGIDEPDLDQLLRFIGPPLKDSFKVYYGFDEQQTDKAIAKFRERFTDIGIFENGVYEGIHELLEVLKQKGKILAIATSKPWVFAERILEKYELRSYFDIVVGSELDEKTRCTKTEVIIEVLRKLQLKDEELSRVVMIGDREHDIIGANNCHLSSIGVRFGYAEPGELEAAGATYIVESVGELKALLCENK